MALHVTLARKNEVRFTYPTVFLGECRKHVFDYLLVA